MAVINNKLNAADPTIVEAPRPSFGGNPKFWIVSTTESIISGADDPRAYKIHPPPQYSIN